MKKRVLAILGVVLVIGILCFHFIPREKLNTINIPFISNQRGDEKKEEMKLISNTLPSDYQNGYFYIKRDDLRENIMYFDYNSKQEVYLCNKPNCTHDTNNCPSFLDFKGLNELFYYNNSLYFLESSAKGTTISASFDGTIQNIDQEPSALYKMNLDGTEKQKVFVTPNGSRISTPFAIKDQLLYGYLEKSEVEKSENASFKNKITERTLIEIDLNTGNYKKLKKGLYEEIIGIYNNKLVIRDIAYIKDPDSFDDNTNAYVNNLYQSNTKIKLFDVQTKKEEIIYEDIFRNMENMTFYKNGIYIKGKDKGIIEYIDFSTKKKEVIKELSQKNFIIETIIDDKMLVYDYNRENGHVNFAYYIDLINNELNEFTLKDNDGYLIEILSSNDDYYFVKTETIYGENYTTWAGTTQKEVIGDNYGLIKKEDYWSSKASYITMTNIE